MPDTLDLGADNPFSGGGRAGAANLWLAAAVGVTCAAGRWKLALFTLALALIALTRLERLEKRLPHPVRDEKHQTEA